MKACDGNRNPSECGFRICNEKFVYRNPMDYKGVKVVNFTRRGGGGATVAKTKKALLVGVWYPNVQQSNGKI